MSPWYKPRTPYNMDELKEKSVLDYVEESREEADGLDVSKEEIDVFNGALLNGITKRKTAKLIERHRDTFTRKGRPDHIYDSTKKVHKVSPKDRITKAMKDEMRALFRKGLPLDDALAAISISEGAYKNHIRELQEKDTENRPFFVKYPEKIVQIKEGWKLRIGDLDICLQHGVSPKELKRWMTRYPELELEKTRLRASWLLNMRKALYRGTQNDKTGSFSLRVAEKLGFDSEINKRPDEVSGMFGGVFVEYNQTELLKLIAWKYAYDKEKRGEKVDPVFLNGAKVKTNDR